MKKDIQKTFFKAFQFGGVVDHCIDIIRERYDLRYHPKNGKVLDEKWQHYYDVTLPEIIKKETEDFDNSVIECTDSPLMDEIEENIEVCNSDAERERYLFSLLKPFKIFSDVFCPIAKIERLKLDIEKCKAEIKMWEQSPDKNEEKRQIDACNRNVGDRTKDIERIYYINSRFCEIVGCDINEKDSVEWCLEVFVHAARKYTDRLDALLLSYGIDLMRLQRESGIYLKSHRQITDVDFYLGSIELAEKYINDLCGNSENVNNKLVKTVNGLKSIYNPDQLGQIFDKLILEKVTKADDKISFLSIFTNNPKGRVFWNSKIHGSKAGLFDLMERITGKVILEPELKNYFDAGESIHRKWRDKSGEKTRLIDKILAEI